MRLRTAFFIPVLLTALSLSAAGVAQQEGDQQPQPAASASSQDAAEAAGQGQATQESPDARSFSGVEEFTAGPPSQTRSYVSPSFQVFETGDSNFNVGAGPQRFQSVTSLVGRLALQNFRRHSQTTLDYLGGGQIYYNHSELNSTIHQLGFSQSYQGRKWGFLFDDQALYLPESSFGFGGFGSSGALGQSLGGAYGSNIASINPVFSPNATLFTGRGSRVANTVLTQVQYLVGRRSSISLSGSYGIIHFLEPRFIDTRNAFFTAGYTRQISSKDFVRISYAYGLFRFKNQGSPFETHLVQLSYGHRLSGRMAMELGGGPELNVFTNPLAGSSTPLTWSAQSSLDYRFRRGSVAVSYIRRTGTGGGVLFGATTDIVRFGLNSSLTRNWSISVSPGFSHNRSLPQTASGNTGGIFNSLFAGATLSRDLGRHASMFFRYNFQTQREEAVPCVAGNCRTTLLRHIVGFGFDFHPRQISVEMP